MPDRINEAKIEKLYDIIRRAIANPQNAREVAEEISKDWFPMMHVDAKSNISFVVGNGIKR